MESFYEWAHKQCLIIRTIIVAFVMLIGLPVALCAIVYNSVCCALEAFWEEFTDGCRELFIDCYKDAALGVAYEYKKYGLRGKPITNEKPQG